MPLAPPRIGLHISASNWASQDTSQLLCVKFYHFFYCQGKSNDRTKSTLVKSAHARLANQPHDASSYCKRNSWLPGEGIVRDIGKVMYTLLYLKWLTDKDILQSTGNSDQCYVPAPMRETLLLSCNSQMETHKPYWLVLGWGGGVGMDTCICMAESLPCSPETTTTLLMGYILVQNKKFRKKKKSVATVN